MRVEIWSDVVCPWCYIGKRRFEQALEHFAGRDDVEVVFKPFQLDPTAPPGVATPVAEVYARKFGGPERAAQIIGHVTEIAAASGIEFHLDRAVRANTLLAHRLLWLAEQRGVQSEMKDELLRAYFTDGRNVGDPAVLVAIAASVGLDATEVDAFLTSDAGTREVLEDLATAADNDITAVPTFVFDGRWTVPGAQDVEVFERVLQRVAALEAQQDPSTVWASRGLHREAAGRAGGPRVVLVHGFTQTGRSWTPVVERLERSLPDHEIVLVDAPGHGGSSAVRGDLVESAGLIAEAGGRATYVGYSMGGRMALHVALGHPDVVERLVLLGATAGIDDGDERAARRRADDALAASIERDGVATFIERWLANPMFAGLPADPADRADRLRNTEDGLAGSLRSCGAGTQEPTWSRLSALGMPVLVLAGEHDDKFRALGERLALAIGSTARFEVVPDAGHAAHLERPDAFVAALTDFLAATDDRPTNISDPLTSTRRPASRSPELSAPRSFGGVSGSRLRR